METEMTIGMTEPDLDRFEWPNEIKPPILFANREWVVTAYGIESLALPYTIQRSRLAETCEDDPTLSDWILHMSGKRWVDIRAFAEAFERALRIHRPRGARRIDIAKSVQVALEERWLDEEFSARVRAKLGSGKLGLGIYSAADLLAIDD
jgi:hypothetical protein